MSPRTGRPPKKNPRNINLNIRLSVKESQDLQECADKLGVTRTEVIVKGIELVRSEIKK